MRAFHNSRNVEYRTPYGAIEPGVTVTLRIDVWEAPDATVTLRTWVDGIGEHLHAMEPAGQTGEGAMRYEADLTPTESGVVWYHFIITDAYGTTRPYGVKDNRFGGSGQLRDWEPPSFQVTVNEAGSTERIVRDIFAGTDPMRQPPAELTVGFLRNEINAWEFSEALETLRETCPAEAFQRAFDLLGSYDQAQLFSLLAGASASEAASGHPTNYHADPAKGGLAKGRLWSTCLIQMLAPCKPVAHPEDRIGPAGLRLPSTQVLEGHEDADCETIVENAIDVHRSLPLFSQGSFESFALNEDVFGFWRHGNDGTAVCVLANSSLRNAYDIPLPLETEAVSDVLSGYGVPIVTAAEAGHLPEGTRETEHYALAHLYQLGTAILYFHPRQRLNQPMAAGLGVLAHITSLPTDDSREAEPAATPAPAENDTSGKPENPLVPEHPGTLGAPACAFVDWLAEAGVRYWQVLPVNPTDEYGSPYAGISAFAGNLRLLEEGMLDGIDFAGNPGYLAFCEREADWLEPYAAFMAIRQTVGEGVTWQEWPEAYRSFSQRLLSDNPQLQAGAERWRQAQYAFELQWGELRAYANERGVQIVGDMPIYVSGDSSDAWANPNIFQLGEDGLPSMVAGCPPDAFAEEGQIWGNPVYDWDYLAANGYGWWLRRLQRAFDLYDFVRLDHFIGFCRYFCIPTGEKATAGSYRPGPGLDFFRAAFEKFGPLPIIAEDLGAITPAVRMLVAACGFPGMDIVQFVDGNDPLSGYKPRPERIAYTGTHDNQTLVGYAAERYAGQDPTAVARTLCEAVAECGADVCVLPLQDIMGLGDEARMNTPGTAKGNWTWQAKAREVREAGETARALAERHAAQA